MFTNWDERGGGRGGGGLEVLDLCLETCHPRPPPPPPSRLTAQLRHRRLHLLLSFPFVPNPQSHSPFPLTKHHIAKTKRALAPFPQTIPLCLSSVEEHVECWIFAYNTTSFADVVKTLVCTMFFASGVYEFMLLWTSCIATPFPVSTWFVQAM